MPDVATTVDTTELLLGVDTHADTHTAALLDHLGRLLGTLQVPADPAGYAQLTAWAEGQGRLTRAGVEGTGDYGRGLCQHLQANGVEVIEVNRPDRSRRRRRGKSDPIDAENAARAVLANDATTIPKQRDGLIEALRVLRIARQSAIKARTVAANQIKDLIVTAPEPIRADHRHLSTNRRVDHAARYQPGTLSDPAEATKHALATIARRHQQLTTEIRALDRELHNLTRQAAPRLLARPGVGPDTAAQLLITAGQNGDRLHNHAALAGLCGTSPVEASSGKHTRHRLNRGGDRQANRALWVIAFTRMRCDPTTKAYVAKRTADGKTNNEITRSLKRYITRELYTPLMADLADLSQPAP